MLSHFVKTTLSSSILSSSKFPTTRILWNMISIITIKRNNGTIFILHVLFDSLLQRWTTRVIWIFLRMIHRGHLLKSFSSFVIDHFFVYWFFCDMQNLVCILHYIWAIYSVLLWHNNIKPWKVQDWILLDNVCRISRTDFLFNKIVHF